MTIANPGLTAKGGAIPASAHGHDHSHDHGHGHAHPAGPASTAPRDAGSAIPRAYRHSMFLASAIERLVIAVLLIGLLWLGIFWAVS